MGGFTSKTQEDLKFFLQRQYDLTNYPCIIHRQSKKEAIVHQITTDSTEQAHRIRSDVNLYKHLGCKSTSSILDYIPLESDKICSDQEFHYILEEDVQKYNLKEEFFARKYYKERFSDNQILAVIKTFLCGLNVYHSQFQRKFHGLIRLDWVTVDQKHSNHLRLTDPLLMADFNFNNVHENEGQDSRVQSHVIESILHEDMNCISEAPQRIEMKKTRFNESKINLNELLADLYVVGIIGLQLYRMSLFQKAQKHDILPLQLSNISNPQLRKIISVLTSYRPQQRGQVYEMVKIASDEAYCLQNCLKKGKLNKDNIQISQKNDLNRPSLFQIGSFKKQNSFSFGTLMAQQPPSISPNFMAYHPSPINQSAYHLSAISQNMNNNYPSNRINNNVNSLSNLKQSFPIYAHNQNQFSLPFKSFQVTKTQSLSNMSTERTIFQSKPMPSPYGSNSKPTIKFNNSNSSTNLPPLTSYNSTNLPPLTSYNSNNNLLPQNSHYLSAQGNCVIKQVLVNKEQEKPRANSFLINQDKNTYSKDIEMSPFKKHQGFSPLSHKHNESQEGIYKQVFNKYSHLNYESLTPSPSNFLSNKDKVIENKKMQQEMDRLLKQSMNKPFQHTQQKSQKRLPVSPMDKHIKTTSPINVLESNSVPPFNIRQKAVNDKSDPSVNQEIPVYRPNKQVEEILKRLGIGSLLYGNGQNIKEDDNQNKKQQTQTALTQNQKQATQSQESETFIHRGAYNIQNQMQFSTNTNEQSNNEQDIHNRQTTPVRPANKTKYNSTIVEVGDQDSQYSSSGVRNTEHAIDLTNHEYVVEEYETGSRYEGYKLNGERDGQGKFFYQDGGYYEGQWKNNKMDGWGKLFYEGGKLAYEGNWCQDEFHGFGKVYNDNPVQLQCGFDFTNFDLLEDYWEYYEGMLVKDTKEGRGKIVLTNGELFEGDFHNDRIQGFGKFSMKEGTMIQGIWRDSKLIKIISS